MMRISTRLFGHGSVVTIATLLSGMVASSAWAQAQPLAADDDQAGAQSDIVVTGSRIARSSFNSPTPVNVLGDEEMTNLSIANVGDALNQLPSFRATTSPTANLYQVQASVGARTPDLRGLGSTRTLTLLDGRRFPSSSDLGTIDLNAVPSLLVARSEIVTGGASAVYGANAVAGVVNIILDTSLEGLKADASGGISQYGDAQEYYAGLAWGGGFAGGRGHTVFGAEYYRQGGVGDIEVRDWGRRHVNFVSNPGWPGDGRPALIVAPNAVFVITAGGLIPSGPLAGTQFDAAGNPMPFQFGDPYAGTLMVGGDPSITTASIIGNVPLLTANSHLSLFSHTEYEFSPALRGTVEFSFANVKGGPVAGADPYDFSKPISIDNPFMPASIRQRAIDAGLTSVPVSRLSTEFGPQQIGRSDNKIYRAMIAFNGPIAGDWKWDAFYEYGHTDSIATLEDSKVGDLFSLAVDAVRAPGGEIVCRSTLTDPGNGCIPINFFGIDPNNVKAKPYIDKTAWQTRDYTSQQAAINLQGTLFSGWAGPVSAAVGAEFRRDRYSGDVDPISAAARFVQNYAVGLPAGGQDVTEEYAEINLPVLKDSPVGKSLEVDGAFRHTRYSVTGSANTWKLGAVYRLDDQLLFRATRSDDIRAPAPAELSPLSSLTGLPLNDPVKQSTYFMNVITSGNPKLKLERASTLTLGGSFQPRFIPGLSLSLDYYDIKIRQAIDTLSAASTINLCADGRADLCAFVERDPVSGLITTVTSSYQNLSQLYTNGWELVGAYSLPLSDVARNLAGNLSFTLNANYIQHLETTNATGTTQEFSNWTGNPGSIQSLLGVPRWRANLITNYANEAWRLTAQMRYIPRGILDPTKIGEEQEGYSQSLPNSANLNYVDARFYTDLTAGVFFHIADGKKGEFYVTINNVFNKAPPDTLRLFGNPLLFDPIGRYFKAGIRIRL